MPRWIARVVLLVLPPLLYSAYAQAQAPTPRPEFEVASIKLNTACAGNTGGAGPSPGRLSLTCVPLRILIRAAYSAFEGSNIAARLMEVVGGPGWLDTDRYDLAAKAEGPVSGAETLGPMLQTLLEERFKLKVHREPRETSIYALTVAKDDSKLQLAKEGSCTPIDLNNLRPSIGPGEPAPKYCGGGGSKYDQGKLIADWYSVTMAEFGGRMLTGNVDRPVIDKTGLTGRYDIHLEFALDMRNGPIRLNGAEVPEGTVTLPESSGPNIFAALQSQLGLKLTPEKSPVDVLVVDHVEKPSDN